LNAKDRRYNQPCWEGRRRSPDWRMRSPSDDGRDNTTLLERGPLGSGGTSNVQGPHAEAGSLSRQMVVSKAPANPWWAAGMPGIRLKRGNIWWKAGHRTARCLSLKPYWGKPTVRNFREGGWKRERWSDYSIQEKDLLTNVLKQLEPIRSVGCRAREFLPVPW
jgi:hypothetical protein